MKFLNWLKEWFGKLFHKEPFVIPDKATVNAMAKTIHDKKVEEYRQRYLRYVVDEIKRRAELGAMKAEFLIYDYLWLESEKDSALDNADKIDIHGQVYEILKNDYDYTLTYIGLGLQKACVLEWRM